MTWEVHARLWGGEVMPRNDAREHVGGEGCWCKPAWDGNTVLVHNSADGREHAGPDYQRRGPDRRQ